MYRDQCGERECEGLDGLERLKTRIKLWSSKFSRIGDQKSIIVFLETINKHFSGIISTSSAVCAISTSSFPLLFLFILWINSTIFVKRSFTSFSLFHEHMYYNPKQFYIPCLFIEFLEIPLLSLLYKKSSTTEGSKIFVSRKRYFIRRVFRNACAAFKCNCMSDFKK